MGGMLGTTRSKVVAAVLAAALVTAPTTVLASHVFNDVDETHTFHKEIGAIHDAGISGPFPDGTFRPSIAATRQAVAAFHERSGGRVSTVRDAVTLHANETADVAHVMLDSGASKQGNGFAHLTVTGYASAASGAACPCLVSLSLSRDGTQLGTATLAQVPGGAGLQVATFALDATEPIGADVLEAYRVTAHLGDAAGAEVTVDASLTAMYVPFSAAGTNAPNQTLTCPQNDGWEPNNEFNTSVRLWTDVPRPTAAIACPGEFDWYGVVLQAGQTVTATVRFSHAEGNIDVCMFDANLNFVNCSQSLDDDETVSGGVPGGGWHYIAVRLVADAGTITGNPYTIEAAA